MITHKNLSVLFYIIVYLTIRINSFILYISMCSIRRHEDGINIIID